MVCTHPQTGRPSERLRREARPEIVRGHNLGSLACQPLAGSPSGLPDGAEIHNIRHRLDQTTQYRPVSSFCGVALASSTLPFSKPSTRSADASRGCALAASCRLDRPGARHGRARAAATRPAPCRTTRPCDWQAGRRAVAVQPLKRLLAAVDSGPRTSASPYAAAWAAVPARSRQRAVARFAGAVDREGVALQVAEAAVVV